MRRPPLKMPGNFVPDSRQKADSSAATIQEQENELEENALESNEVKIQNESATREESSLEKTKADVDTTIAVADQAQEDTVTAKTETQDPIPLPMAKGIRKSVLNLRAEKGSPIAKVDLSQADTIDKEIEETGTTQAETKKNEIKTLDAVAPETKTVLDTGLDNKSEVQATIISENENNNLSDLPAEDSDPDLELTTETVKRTYPIPQVPRAQLLYPGFQNALSFMRDSFKLPREMQLEQQKSSRTWLLSKLDKIDYYIELQDFSQKLSRKDQALLFPVLATLKKKNQIKKLEDLILLLGNRAQYIHGWLTLQFAYPRSVVATTLTRLCLEIEDRNFAFPHRYNNYPKLRFRSDKGGSNIVWSNVPLITTIAHPNSRHFIKDIANNFLDSGLDFDVFCRKYAIYPDLSLGLALIAKIEEEQLLERQDSLKGRRFFSQRQ
ncbi:MAG TPA: hypothetical protein GXX72_08010 [Clostridiaceae bacterium]|nr:hypothetical protein [Clostridiaceae bacterium]